MGRGFDPISIPVTPLGIPWTKAGAEEIIPFRIRWMNPNSPVSPRTFPMTFNSELSTYGKRVNS